MRHIKRKLTQTVSDVITHEFHLRIDMAIYIELPIDISCDEAERIGNIVRGFTYAEDSCIDDLETYEIPIREWFKTKLEVPINLNENEARRFAHFLDAIPFGF
ncbi:hypothetical protein DBZ36_01195 [Alginatibacterium sediminis]|uniref:Uncharacterized protein n=1 Tax=Alginatibacterium sediminis TaxID=2164068 RepID=A0A420ENK9_9ALTE|nr:hypothetical protein [Alginatibacterium sediminis]RKF22292.1 hypothetical protein DBZ36_01195 [Alginatibacterium sediminis]